MSRTLFRLTLQVHTVLRISNRLSNEFVLNHRKTFHTFNKHFQKNNEDITLPIISKLATSEDKSRDVYLEMLNQYKIREKHRRGHVEFIYGAMKYMKEFGVEKDLEVYRSLIDVMPKGKFVAQNVLQAEFMHYPKQQDCILNLLEKMEYNNVIPDPELGQMLVNIFGERAYVVRKFMRMLYWMPKFKNLSPWPLPQQVPKEPFDLAMLAIKRITSADPTTEITVYSTRTVEDAVDDTWIISGQSEEQKKLLANHDAAKPVNIEGAFRVWLRDASVYYFVLRGDTPPRKEEEEKEIDIDDVSKINIGGSFFAPPVSEVTKVPSIHEQEDGVYYAVCATGSSSRDSLLSWVRILQKQNPRLLEVPVLFTLKAPTTDIAKINKNNNETKDRDGDEKNKR